MKFALNVTFIVRLIIVAIVMHAVGAGFWAILGLLILIYLSDWFAVGLVGAAIVQNSELLSKLQQLHTNQSSK